ncbi:MAG TPA: mechanosensitive ion channel family protein [Desulfobulbus sp.]|nr:mechanosensitive ion channel family protein [Desulfobulbus sp.]
MRTYFFLVACFLGLACSIFSPSPAVQAAQSRPAVSPVGPEPDQMNSVLAKLSDEQVRSLLIAELQRDAAGNSRREEEPGGFVARVARGLHVLDGEDGKSFGKNLRWAWRHSRSLPDELSRALRQFAADSSITTAWKNIGLLVLIFFAAFLVELMFSGITGRLRKQFQEQLTPDLTGLMRFWAAVLQQLPSLVHLVIFSGTSLLLYFWSPVSGQQYLRFFFLALLYSIVGIRLVRRLSLFFCSPEDPKLRLLPITDDGARRLHNSTLFLFTYLIFTVSLLALLNEVGVQRVSMSLLAIGSATIFLLLIALVSLLNRQQVAEYILSGEEQEGGAGWLMQQLAGLWHVLVFGYLLMVWFFLVYNEFSGSGRQNGAFLLSLFIVPVFLILDRIGGWVVRSVVETMRIYDLPPDEGSENYEEELGRQKRKEQQLVGRVRRLVRLGILLVLGVWMLSFWGYHIPYAHALINATFDILLTLTLALVFWRVASSYIERKIREATPDEEENEEQDDEWGAAATRGRGYTLYPMVRKFLGTVLITMVTMIVLSSLGVDIGPLLAGAGVIGLAIGFGAQKLVSDVFSGFFYLLDDAFRVGEYLQAGSVSGAVEAITLRNVMLRHHRGMLQIVPYSELGAITNFMRGGIVVKFNLEFPYDSNIDQIRKIIKKVGQAMLDDPEFGKDFIRPVKSQGVREISNSVMVIRVKFTAQPGTHFVIRREAYRRITEALAAKGIHYAHRKVIVEIPEDEDNGKKKPPTAQQMQRALEAGAAAGQAAMEADTAEKEGSGGSSGPAMPGM